MKSTKGCQSVHIIFQKWQVFSDTNSNRPFLHNQRLHHVECAIPTSLHVLPKSHAFPQIRSLSLDPNVSLWNCFAWSMICCRVKSPSIYCAVKLMRDNGFTLQLQMSVVKLIAFMSCNMHTTCFFTASCICGKTISVTWRRLGISYFGSKTLTKRWNPTLSSNESGWSSRTMNWVSTSVICLALGLSLVIFSRLAKVCCRVGCWVLTLLLAANSPCSLLCFSFRCFIILLVL